MVSCHKDRTPFIFLKLNRVAYDLAVLILLISTCKERMGDYPQEV